MNLRESARQAGPPASGLALRRAGTPPNMPLSPEVCVVIPAYEAERTVRPLVEEIRRMGLPVIVVDDASRDSTAHEAAQAGATVIERPFNSGKGSALREGIWAAVQQGFPWILTMDADGQHLPQEIPRFLEEAHRMGVDLVIGNRMNHPQRMPLARRLTNRLMSRLLSRIAGQSIPDTQCGFRLIRRAVLEKVLLTSEKFEIESELVVKAAWAGFRINSIPVSSVYHRNMSFIRPIADTVRFFRFLRSLKKSSPVSSR